MRARRRVEWTATARGALAAAALHATIGCGPPAPGPAGRDTEPVTSAAGAAPAVSAAPSAAQSAAPSAAGFGVGRWAGTFEARIHEPSAATREHALASWTLASAGSASRPGPAAPASSAVPLALVGPGELELEIEADGRVVGRVRGAAGELGVDGHWDEVEREVRATCRPASATPAALGGTLLLRADGERLIGRLQLSSGDARTLRSAEVAVERRPAGADGPSAVGSPR